MKKIGFDIKNEFFPSFDKFKSNTNQRLMFMKFFNQGVCSNMRFTKYELKECKTETLFNIFIKKIRKNLQLDSYIYSPIVKIDIEKSNKVNNFKKRVRIKLDMNFSILNSLNESNIDVAVNLIDVLDECNYSLFLDGEKNFKKFVSDKILKSSEKRKVNINSESIDIISEENNFYTKIFTFWQLLDSDNLQIDSHVQKAIDCIKTSEFKQVYLVYPKNDKFNKHIQVKTRNIIEDEYAIKLIPYSLRSTLR
ncbi:MAG: hypothetical protein C0625_04360 [Arcobacter sp.]|nr:MAG: hypothetical protein C0625_04360 [Arcobacter sp.]